MKILRYLISIFLSLFATGTATKTRTSLSETTKTQHTKSNKISAKSIPRRYRHNKNTNSHWLKSALIAR